MIIKYIIKKKDVKIKKSLRNRDKIKKNLL